MGELLGLPLGVALVGLDDGEAVGDSVGDTVGAMHPAHVTMQFSAM